MLPHGFLRVAAASPELRVADPKFNAARTLDLLKQAEGMGCDLVVFPEMGLTGYTCGDLFHDRTLQRESSGDFGALFRLLAEAADEFDGVYVVGLPVPADGRLFNAAAVCQRGKVLGVVPKSFLPTYREFYDTRYFAPASAAVTQTVRLAGWIDVPFGPDLLFTAGTGTPYTLGVEVCEDLWVPTPPSGRQALAGATVLVNPSASPETVGKAGYRRQLVLNQSARCIAGYVYSGAGPGESSQDLVFGGHCLIAENGTLLAESERFRRDGHLTVADIDIDRLDRERAATNSFHDTPAATYRRLMQVPTNPVPRSGPVLIRHVDPRPFVPSDPATLDDRCAEIFQTQVSGLTTRLAHINASTVASGVSGGLDSTLALLVACKAFDALGKPRTGIKGLTMPGFGTTGRTRKNADHLMELLGTSRREADIRQMSLDQMRAIGHSPFGIPLDGLTVETLTEKLRALPADKRHDLTFENTQARVRTSLLMNTAFVVGTGDLSELAVGWCTYNADHMSMYNPNVGVPKTLVAFLVRWAARTQFDGPAREVLLDVADTVISPELLPVAADGSAHSTEETVGPYELIDFFLYHFLRFGTPPEKILFLAEHATFSKPYTTDDLRHWLKEFLRRFFASQFKRSALPDGPKVGSVTLSPRGDWRMPSDASAAAWLEWAEGA